jgi:hypothetical protein
MKHVVTMPEGQYLAEHRRLIKLLDSSKDRKIKAEAKKQKKEIAEYVRKRNA